MKFTSNFQEEQDEPPELSTRKRQQHLGNIYIYRLKLLKELLLFGWTCTSDLSLFMYLFVSICCLQQS